MLGSIEAMNKKIIIGMLLIILSALLTGCTIGFQPKTPNNNRSAGQELPEDKKLSQNEPQEIELVDEQIKAMSLEEKIGQMVIVGFDGYTIDDNTIAMIKKYHVGGLILFGRNVKSSVQLLDLVNSLKAANINNKIPLFISIDEEGGKISRMPNEFKKLPTNKTIGKINNCDFSYKIGSILSEEIKSFGFNLNFAPVLDLNSNPRNSVIGDRSFGSDAKIVSNLGVETMKGIKAGGVIPVVKHFPGHGDTAIDSHLGLPFIDHNMNRLEKYELVPFKEAINNQADAVMIAHIVLNKVDRLNPASLSKAVITDLLRKQLNFTGVVISDDLTMGAIVKNYNLTDAAVNSINAGSDIVLVCHGYDHEVAVLDALRKAVEDGSIPEERVDESVSRILKLKYKYNLTDNLINSIDIEKINSKIRTVLDSCSVSK